MRQSSPWRASAARPPLTMHRRSAKKTGGVLPPRRFDIGRLRYSLYGTGSNDSFMPEYIEVELLYPDQTRCISDADVIPLVDFFVYENDETPTIPTHLAAQLLNCVMVDSHLLTDLWHTPWQMEHGLSFEQDEDPDDPETSWRISLWSRTEVYNGEPAMAYWPRCSECNHKHDPAGIHGVNTEDEDEYPELTEDYTGSYIYIVEGEYPHYRMSHEIPQ